MGEHNTYVGMDVHARSITCMAIANQKGVSLLVRT